MSAPENPERRPSADFKQRVESLSTEVTDFLKALSTPGVQKVEDAVERVRASAASAHEQLRQTVLPRIRRGRTAREFDSHLEALRFTARCLRTMGDGVEAGIGPLLNGLIILTQSETSPLTPAGDVVTVDAEVGRHWWPARAALTGCVYDVFRLEHGTKTPCC